MEGSVTNMTGILVGCKQDRHGPCYTLAASISIIADGFALV
jgi:hypothetical protein